MPRRIVFRHMDHSPVIEEFANTHLDKLEKFLSTERTPIFIDLVMTPAPTHAHNNVELRLKTPHYELVAHHEGKDLYQEIDRVVDKMLKELAKAKDKRLSEGKTVDIYHDA